MESLLIPVIAAAIGWLARHNGLFVPPNATPQTASGAGGTVPPGSVPSDLPSLIASIVSEEVRKGVTYLEGRLLPPKSATVTPQT